VCQVKRFNGLLAHQPVGDDLVQAAADQHIAHLVLAFEHTVAALRRQRIGHQGQRDAVVAVQASHLFDEVGGDFYIQAVHGDGRFYRLAFDLTGEIQRFEHPDDVSRAEVNADLSFDFSRRDLDHTFGLGRGV